MGFDESDYQPPRELWVPDLNAEADKSPKIIEFGTFFQKTWKQSVLGRWAFFPVKYSRWHILTQYHDGRGAALCGTVGNLKANMALTDVEFGAGDYKRHTCIDCLHRYERKIPAPDIVFNSRPLVTFDDRKI